MKVYNGIKGINKPVMTHEDYLGEGYNRKIETYVNAIKAFAKTNGKGKYKGETVKFQVADGYAEYIVYKPTELIHLDVGDGYREMYIERLRAKDITDHIEQQKRWDAIWINAGGQADA